MEPYPRLIRLKNGKAATLRPFEEKDMEALIAFFRNLPVNDRMYLRFDVRDREKIIHRFGRLDADIIYPLIVEQKDTIIAQGNLRRAEFGWKRHLGEIRVVVAHDFQQQGLCTILTRELVMFAVRKDLYKIEAQIMEDQSPAIAAFERMGFKKEAVLRKHVTDIENNRKNLIIMSLDIQDLWYLLEDSFSERAYSG